MNYRIQALILGSLLIAGGISVLAYLAVQAQIASSPIGQNVVGGSIIVFMGLGLILIGTLTMFAAPETLVPSQLLSSALSPSAENLFLIIESFKTSSRAIHVPKLVLGRESEVFLVISRDEEPAISVIRSAQNVDELTWSPTYKVLAPTGIGLMKAYEKVLNRDFLGLDALQLERLLSKAIVPELQLGSGFSMRELSGGRHEATWTKPTVVHTCTRDKGPGLPELCCLCSSVACALAKATGKPIWVEESNRIETLRTVVTLYRVLGD